MASLKEIVIHVEQSEDYTFILSCHDEDHQFLTRNEMERYLFQWHESSFYGTFLEDAGLETPAVLLSPCSTCITISLRLAIDQLSFLKFLLEGSQPFIAS